MLTGCTGTTGLQVEVLYDQQADFGFFLDLSLGDRTARRLAGGRGRDGQAGQGPPLMKRLVVQWTATRPRPDETPDLLLTYYGGIEDTLQLEGVRWEASSSRVVWTGASPLAETRSYQGRYADPRLRRRRDRGDRLEWCRHREKRRAPVSCAQRIEQAVKKALDRVPTRVRRHAAALR